jgi:hypothetical protein
MTRAEPMPNRSRGLTVLLTFLAACTAPPPDVVLDTLDNGTVVVRNADRGLWTEGGMWKPRELTRIGAEAGASAYLLSRVNDVQLGPDGRVYVLEGRSRELRVFALDGTHLATIGRSDTAPGAFTNPTGLAWGPSGDLWVVDPGSERYTLVSPAGDLVATYPRSGRTGGYHWEGAIIGDFLYEPRFPGGPGENSFIRYAIGAAGLVAADTVGLPAPAPTYGPRPGGDGSEAGGAPHVSWAFDRDGGLWFGATGSYRLWHRAPDGDTLRLVELDRVRRRADRWAAHGGITVDDRGWVWVARAPVPFPGEGPTSSPTTFDVFDPAGIYYGALVLDIAVEPPPVIVGSRVVGVDYDDRGVPSVVVYWLAGRDPLVTN